MSRLSSGMVERLETRRLLSSVTLASHGLLRVRGDAGALNTITIANDATDPTMFDVTITGVKPNNTPTVPLSQKFAKSSVLMAFIVGGAKADTISVGRSNGAFAIPTLILGGSGDDTITTGAEADFIDAGGGNDTVTSGGGTDLVRGGSGDDVITLGGGSDKADGGAGNDRISAGDGNVTLNGGAGDDTITAGDGADLIHGGRGNDSVTAGDGNDTLWGGAGDDTLTAGNGDDTFGGIIGHNTLTGGTGHNTYLVRTTTNNTITSFDPAKDTLTVVKRESLDPRI